MFTLQDGREHLYQWDLDRYILVNDKNICEVHFCNRTSDCSLVVEVKDGLAPIPNILLQEARPIRAYAYCDDKYTLTEQQFTVKSRTRPDDYVYTETDTITVRDMVDRADKALEQTSEALANSEVALANANAAVETASSTNERLETAVSECEASAEEALSAKKSCLAQYTNCFNSARDARESAAAAETAEANVNAVVDTIEARVDAAVDERVTDYYTKEETATLISDCKDSIYLDVQNIGINAAEVGADQASVLDRLASGEALSIYLKFSSIEYFPARIVLYSESSIVLNTPDVLSNSSGDVSNYEYNFTKSGDTWTARRTVDSKPQLVTHDELTKAIEDAATADIDLSNYYTKEEVEAAIANSGGSCNVPLLPDGDDIDITYLTPGIYGINCNVRTLSEIYCTELNAHVALEWWVSNGMLLIRDRNVVAWGQDNADIMFYVINMNDYVNQDVTLSPTGRMDINGWATGAVSETRVQQMIDASLGVIENGSY